MASVVGLLEERELAARERVEGLREKADRVPAELAEAETDWQEWLIARQRVGEVLSVPRIREAGVPDPVPAEEPSASEPEPEPVVDAPAGAPARRAARAGSIVPAWWPALTAEALAVDCQRILTLLAERRSGGDGVMTCQEIAAGLGLAPVPACVEGVRSKKRLADRGWATEPAWAGSRSPTGQPAAHEHRHRPHHHLLVDGGQRLVVAYQAARAEQPGERPLHGPPPRQYHEPRGVVATLDDLHGELELLRAGTSPSPRRPPQPPSAHTRAIFL